MTMKETLQAAGLLALWCSGLGLLVLVACLLPPWLPEWFVVIFFFVLIPSLIWLAGSAAIHVGDWMDDRERARERER